MKQNKDCNVDMLREIASIAGEIAIDRYNEGMIENNMYSQLIVALLDMQDTVMSPKKRKPRKKKTLKLK